MCQESGWALHTGNFQYVHEVKLFFVIVTCLSNNLTPPLSSSH